MRIRTSSLKMLVVAVLCCLGFIAFVAMPLSLNTYAHSYDYGNENMQHEDNEYESALSDVLEGQTVAGYHQERDYQALLAQAGGVQPLSVQSKNSCDTHSTNCGQGRENGFSSTFLSTGCRNWEGWSYGNYGDTDIPFWLDMATFNTIANVTHRNTLIDDLRTQAEMWNQAVMHDGTGQIVNLYEVGVGSDTRPANINGNRVVEVRREDGNYAGQFKPPVWLFSPSIVVRINYDATGGGTRPGRNIDTPIHEFGHLLGLNDLDADLPSTSWPTHRTLMGYSRGTTTANLGEAIKYQDIQGIAVLNNRHTTHQWNRYVVSGNKYLHFCFYCDTVDSVTSAKSGSSAMVNASTCTHNYQPMVSHGDRHWHKCTSCYKVVESPFLAKGINNGGTVTIEITGQADNRAAIEIPRQIGGQNVTHIANGAFSGRTNITAVTFESTSNVTTIGNSAFSSCTQLSQISIPASVTNIGFDAFRNCSALTIVTIQNGVTSIGDSVFYGCANLTRITIPSSVTTIGDYAFFGCTKLEDITIPSSVTSIRIYECLNCNGCPYRDKCVKGEGEFDNRRLYINPKFEGYKAMASDLLCGEKGIKMRSLRSVEVESVFGDIKANFGLRRFTLRGIKKVKIEYGLWSIAHNMRKLAKKA